MQQKRRGIWSMCGGTGGGEGNTTTEEEEIGGDSQANSNGLPKATDGEDKAGRGSAGAGKVTAENDSNDGEDQGDGPSDGKDQGENRKDVGEEKSNEERRVPTVGPPKVDSSAMEVDAEHFARKENPGKGRHKGKKSDNDGKGR